MLTAEKTAALPHSPAYQLLDRLVEARKQSDALFHLVHPGSLYERPIPERHRIIFYVGHLEAFDWNLLSHTVPSLKKESLDPKFDHLFAFGIDPVGGGLPTDVPSDWPPLEAVRDYVSKVRHVLDEHLAAAIPESSLSARDGFPLSTLLNVAVEHRLMHVETLSYMLHQLPLNMKVRQSGLQQPGLPQVVAQPPIPKMIAVPAGPVTLGLTRNSDTFGWDNEFEAHKVDVPAFKIDQFKVSNQQFLEFVAADGYTTRALWSDDDWNWKTANKVSHPLFWKNDGNRWLWRGMFEEVPLPLAWPVYVSQAEAAAYVRWAGKSLPTEAEWHRAAYGTPEGRTKSYPWGNEFPDGDSSCQLGNFDLQSWDPVPVNAHPAGQSAFGVHDLLGNGWEWTSTIFAPFPGFQPFPFYRGYSADFFDGKHFVMKGGSARTAACMLRPTFRNWFQAHYQYVYAGFRCVSR